MRITGGKARGITLKAPKGDRTRPATDRMREAVFSSLGPSVTGSHVLDLFAGTGSYGLEALSRGAASVTFVEHDRSALSCLQANGAAVLRSCERERSSMQLVEHDVYRCSKQLQRYELIFVDPPYASIAANLEQLFAAVIDSCTVEGARVCLEVPGDFALHINGWEVLRRIGKAGTDKPTVALLQRTAAHSQS